MPVTQVYFTQLRNLLTFSADFTPGINLLVGHNGSGKTSILEAIYCLAYAKSFRANQLRHIIHHETDYCQLDCRYLYDTLEHTIRFTYQASQTTRLLNQHPPSNANDIAKMMPTVFIDTGTHRSFANTPKFRRDFFNWCCFYHSPHFASAIHKYTRILSQRNHYLKQARHLGQQGLDVWNSPLLFYADTIHQDRLVLSDLLAQSLQYTWSILAPHLPKVKLIYSPGWPADKSLPDALSAATNQDIQLGYTQHGPHRADLRVTTEDGLCVYKYFSEGQQKLLSYALKLAQLETLQRGDIACPGILLIDDLPAELDRKSRASLLAHLREKDYQCFISGLDIHDFPDHADYHATHMDRST